MAPQVDTAAGAPPEDQEYKYLGSVETDGYTFDAWIPAEGGDAVLRAHRDSKQVAERRFAAPDVIVRALKGELEQAETPEQAVEVMVFIAALEKTTDEMLSELTRAGDQD